MVVVTWLATVALAAVAAVVELAFGNRMLDDASDARTQLGLVFAFIIFATVGALIRRRHTRHAIGHIYSSGALAATIGTLASGVSDMRGLPRAVETPAALLASVLWVVPLAVLLPLPLLLYPSGHPTRRLRFAPRVAALAVAFIAVRFLFAPGPISGSASHPINPLGLVAVKSTLEGLSALGVLALALTTIAALISLFVRYRRAQGAERQQLRWLGWAGLWAIVLVFSAGPGTFGGFYPKVVIRILMPAAPYLLGVAISLLPLATAVAILRYRLYEIDRIVSRTVSYVVITALLAGTFALVVLVPTAVIGSRGHTPSWLVAVATLLVAFLFQPLRRHVQARVDRRFNRARYDASRTIEEFAARLREEIDLDELHTDLVRVVERTMQPSRVSLWTRLAG